MNNLKIFTNQSNQNVINKKIFLVTELKCTFRDDIDILKPVLIVKNYTGGNYCYVSDFDRYYYIDDVRVLKGGVYQLFCSVDVLRSYAIDLESAEYYSNDGVLHSINNEIDFMGIYNPKKFLLILDE